MLNNVLSCLPPKSSEGENSYNMFVPVKSKTKFFLVTENLVRNQVTTMLCIKGRQVEVSGLVSIPPLVFFANHPKSIAEGPGGLNTLGQWCFSDTA